MNQKDYKEIAGIIKSSIDEDNKNSFGVAKESVHYGIGTATQIAEDLADYFEREELSNDKLKKLYGMNWRNEIFNRQQFLKDCGVEK